MKKLLFYLAIVCISLSIQAQTLNDFNHTFNGSIRCIAITSDRIYVGGGFSTIDTNNTHYNIAAFDRTTHQLLSWNAWCNDFVDCITVSPTEDTIFIGGEFTHSGNGAFSSTRSGIAAYDKNGNLLGWNPSPGGIYVFALTVHNNTLYAGGNFSSLNGQTRNGLASFSLSSMAITSWNPNVNGTVNAIAVSQTGDTIYAGGSFTQVNGGTTRNYLASFNSTDSVATSWDPNLNNSISAMAISGNTLIVGGSFVSINGGGVTRNYLASFNTSNGSLNSWNPNLNQIVDAVQVKGSIVYAAGNFTSVNGGTTRNYVAAFDTSSSTATMWNPNADARTRAIGCTSTEVYIGGHFSAVSGSNRSIVAGMDDPNNAALPVELASFTASAKQNEVALQWQTATEVNNYGFEIEKSRRQKSEDRSPDKTNGWDKVGFVEGNGTTSASKEYSFIDKNIGAGKYLYRLKQIDRDGKFSFSQEVEVIIGGVPNMFALEQNYPNPFNPSTVISYQLPVNSHVTLKVFDVIGREVATLVNEVKEAGRYSATFDAAKLSSGIYFAQLQSGDKIQLKKMLLLK
ncbi:MAG: T9SS type A sorting domain-containing protein [Bacteroidota bacterium]